MKPKNPEKTQTKRHPFIVRLDMTLRRNKSAKNKASRNNPVATTPEDTAADSAIASAEALVSPTTPEENTAGVQEQETITTLAAETKPVDEASESCSESQTQDSTPAEQAITTDDIQPKTQWFTPTEHWKSLAEAVVGLAHRDANPPLPCQDSAAAKHQSRPLVIVADGAGSSAVSEIGSQAVVSGLSRLINTLEQQLAELLDKPDANNQQARSLGLLLVKHALGILEDLAASHRRPLKDFRCTLLLAIHGKQNTLWLKIGDGALVVEHMQMQAEQMQSRLFTLGEVGKGEFANLTTFIDEHLQPSDVQTGLHPSILLSGFAAMSDGAADKLVANDGSRVADQVSHWLHALRQGKLKRRTLTRAFYADSFTKGTTGDDCSIAMAACELAQPQ